VQVTVVVASGDSPEFRRQSREYQADLKMGTYLEVPGKDHFSVIEALDDPSDDLTQVLIRQINALGGRTKPRPTPSAFPFLALTLVLGLAFCSKRSTKHLNF